MRSLVAAVVLLAGCRDCASGPPAERTSRPAARADAAPRPVEVASRPVLPEATLGELEGEVRLDRTARIRRAGVEPPTDTGPVAAAPDDELEIGDAVVVGATGAAQIRLPDQGRLELGNESRMTVSPWGMNELGLVRGRLRVVLESPGLGRRVLKVSMPGAYVLVQGTDLVVGAGDDGSARILALDGPAVVRTATGKIDLAAGGSVEVDADGRAGRPGPAPAEAEALASMDGWVQGRRELARRALPATLSKIASRIATEVDEAPTLLTKVSSRRDANRELLAGLRKKGPAKAGPGPEGIGPQKVLAQASEALIEDTDRARAIFGRVIGRFELARHLQPSGPPEVDALAQRVEALRAEASRLFRRSPRRPRPVGKSIARPRPDIVAPTPPEPPARSAGENH